MDIVASVECQCASMSPGMSVRPLQSMIVAPSLFAGVTSPGVRLSMSPSLTRTCDVSVSFPVLLLKTTTSLNHTASFVTPSDALIIPLSAR
ncbi:unannotated protein [freshwater metagenome]|uniref:Unannotated protein n=1 Tax=freshwater metagenome TaxID=449393 RepID=A0A6J7QKL2_9ZZZZ